MSGDGEEAMDVDLDDLPPTNTHTTSQQSTNAVAGGDTGAAHIGSADTAIHRSGIISSLVFDINTLSKLHAPCIT